MVRWSRLSIGKQMVWSFKRSWKMLGTSGASALMLNLPSLPTFTLSIMNHSPLLDCSSIRVVVSEAPSSVPSIWNLLPLHAVSATMAIIIKKNFFIVVFFRFLF